MRNKIISYILRNAELIYVVAALASILGVVWGIYLPHKPDEAPAPIVPPGMNSPVVFGDNNTTTVGDTFNIDQLIVYDGLGAASENMEEIERIWKKVKSAIQDNNVEDAFVLLDKMEDVAGKNKEIIAGICFTRGELYEKINDSVASYESFVCAANSYKHVGILRTASRAALEVEKFDVAKSYAEQVLSIAELKKDESLLASSVSDYAKVLFFMQKYESAEYYYRQALDYASRSDPYDLELHSSIHISLGAVLRKMQKFDDAIKTYQQAIDFVPADNLRLLADLFNGLAVAYHYAERNDEARLAINTAFQYAQKSMSSVDPKFKKILENFNILNDV